MNSAEQLTARQNEVINRARLVASWKPDVDETDNPSAALELEQLRMAVDALNTLTDTLPSRKDD